MILGRKLRNLFTWPALRLKAETSACINCKRCTRDCPMSLDVNAMVQAGAMENSECVLCGTLRRCVSEEGYPLFIQFWKVRSQYENHDLERQSRITEYGFRRVYRRF